MIKTMGWGDRYKEKNKVSQSLPVAGTLAVMHSSSARRCPAYLGFHITTQASQELLSKSVFGQLCIQAFFQSKELVKSG